MQMEAVDVLCWIVIGGAILLVLGFFVWSLLEIAGLSDDISDEQYRQYQKEHGDEEDSLQAILFF